MPFHYFVKERIGPCRCKSEIDLTVKAWSSGDEQALEKLMPFVDDELPKIAHNYMRNERSGYILETTALVNEVSDKTYLREHSWENRKQFYALVQSACDKSLLIMRGEQSGLITLT